MSPICQIEVKLIYEPNVSNTSCWNVEHCREREKERGGGGDYEKLAQSAYVTAAHLWLLIFLQHSQLMGIIVYCLCMRNLVLYLKHIFWVVPFKCGANGILKEFLKVSINNK